MRTAPHTVVTPTSVMMIEVRLVGAYINVYTHILLRCFRLLLLLLILMCVCRRRVSVVNLLPYREDRARTRSERAAIMPGLEFRMLRMCM